MVLAGIELIFFTLAGIMLCLELSMEKKNVEITHRCFGLLLGSACTSQGLFQPPMLCWVHKKLGGEGAQLREQTQTGQRDIPYHVTPRPVCYWEGLAGGGRQQSQLGDRQRRSAGGERLYCSCFCVFFPLFFPFPSFSILLY